MKFRLTTDKGTFISIPQNDINNMELMLNLSFNLVNALYKGDIDSYSDDVKGLMSVLDQMFFESMQGVTINKVEELTEEKVDVSMDNSISISERSRMPSANNVVSFNFRKDE